MAAVTVVLAKDMVVDEPRVMVAPPESPVPVNTPMELLANCPLVMPAVAERLEVESPDMPTLEAAVSLPLESTVKVGMVVAEP